MCALFESAGNGNACAQISQDRQRGRGKVQTNPQNPTIARYSFFDCDGGKREFRFLFKAWAKVANLHTARLGLEISLPVICHIENL